MSILRIETPPAYLPLLSLARYKGAYGGRGSGKSHFFAELLIETCLSQPTRAVCIREVQKSLSQSMKLLLEDKIKRFGVGDSFNILNNVIEAPYGGIISFQGMQDHTAESIKSLEGYDIALVEEAQSLSARSLRLLRPTIRKEGSQLWFLWNPENEDDPVDEFLRGANKPDNSIVIRVNYKDNPWFNATLEEERQIDLKGKSDNYLHVWEGEYSFTLEGAVYADEMRQALLDKRITRIPVVSNKPVHTYWDLGHSDFTAIWFVQSIGHEFRLIDYYQNQFKKIPHYLQVLQDKGYVYKGHILPHDARYETLSAERTTERQIKDAYPNASVTVLPNLGVKDGIDAARSIFNQCWFDEEKCSEGLQSLRRYSYERDTNGKWGRNPAHNEYSHGADAFRYMAVSIKGEGKPKAEFPRGTFGSTNNWMNM